MVFNYYIYLLLQLCIIGNNQEFSRVYIYNCCNDEYIKSIKDLAKSTVFCDTCEIRLRLKILSY